MSIALNPKLALPCQHLSTSDFIAELKRSKISSQTAPSKATQATKHALSCMPGKVTPLRAAQSSAKQNRLLAKLSADSIGRLMENLEWISLPLGKVLQEAGDCIDYVYFPTTAIISISSELSDGASAEVAIIGNDGFDGISLAAGGEMSPTRATVQNAGYGFRLKVNAFKAELEQTAATRQICLRYLQAIMLQMAQIALCNRHHYLRQQYCRRLLQSLDLVPTRTLNMTQEMMATILGVRREGVTEAAGKLQREGFIRYSRGVIEILDRDSLEKNSCECYGVLKRESNLLFSGSANNNRFHSGYLQETETFEIPRSNRHDKLSPSTNTNQIQRSTIQHHTTPFCIS